MAISWCFIFMDYCTTGCRLHGIAGHKSAPGESCVLKTVHHIGAVSCLPVQPLNNIVGIDLSPVFAGKIVISRGLLNTILHFISTFFQLHKAQFLHYCFDLLPSCCLVLFGKDALSILVTSFILERGETKNTLL